MIFSPLLNTLAAIIEKSLPSPGQRHQLIIHNRRQFYISMAPVRLLEIVI
jgi:hypothetical protein